MKLDCRLYRVLHHLEVGARMGKELYIMCVHCTYVRTHTHTGTFHCTDVVCTYSGTWSNHVTSDLTPEWTVHGGQGQKLAALATLSETNPLSSLLVAL